MARNYKRDSRGRFARIGAARRARRNRKASKLESKNRRVAAKLKRDKEIIGGTPLEAQVQRRMARRAAKARRLRGR